MLRISLIVFGIVLLVSCTQENDKKFSRVVLRFNDSLVIKQNIPVFIGNERYIYLTKEDFDDSYVDLFLSDTLDLNKLSYFGLRRLDYFGSLGVYIGYHEETGQYKDGDTVFVNYESTYDNITTSSIDTASILEIIKVMQEIDEK